MMTSIDRFCQNLNSDTKKNRQFGSNMGPFRHDVYKIFKILPIFWPHPPCTPMITMFEVKSMTPCSSNPVRAHEKQSHIRASLLDMSMGKFWLLSFRTGTHALWKRTTPIKGKIAITIRLSCPNDVHKYVHSMQLELLRIASSLLKTTPYILTRK